MKPYTKIVTDKTTGMIEKISDSREGLVVTYRPMRYHNITKDDMLNGEGLRVVLWTAGCSHHCKGCHNPVTWNPNDGLEFTEKEKEEIATELRKNYISGITFSGGDPLHEANQETILELVQWVRKNFPNKTIWLYSGYRLDEIFQLHEEDLQYSPVADVPSRKGMEIRAEIIRNIDVFVDGRFVEELKSEPYPFAGSTNQNVISVENGNFVLKKY